MTTQEYLKAILADQALSQDSDALKQLRARRKEVEDLLRRHFENSHPTIRYGGSKAKGTMIRELYDLDVICYFEHDENGAGDTLGEIFDNVAKPLMSKYVVEHKASALRLKSLDPTEHGMDFHIDVVPGRFTDENKEDSFLFRSTGEKNRLKTNLQVHIDHVKGSGFTEEIRLVKLWKIKRGLWIKNFVLELLVIEILKDSDSGNTLEKRLLALWERLRDDIDDIKIEDPANPTGNDLSELFDDTVRQSLSSAASSTLREIEESGWESIFGPPESMSRNERIGSIDRAAAVVVGPKAKPWLND